MRQWFDTHAYNPFSSMSIIPANLESKIEGDVSVMELMQISQDLSIALINHYLKYQH